MKNGNIKERCGSYNLETYVNERKNNRAYHILSELRNRENS